MYAGDESLSDEQQAPELYDESIWEDDVDPLDRPCDECGAEPGEECRPACTAQG